MLSTGACRYQISTVCDITNRSYFSSSLNVSDIKIQKILHNMRGHIIKIYLNLRTRKEISKQSKALVKRKRLKKSFPSQFKHYRKNSYPVGNHIHNKKWFQIVQNILPKFLFFTVQIDIRLNKGNKRMT